MIGIAAIILTHALYTIGHFVLSLMNEIITVYCLKYIVYSTLLFTS